MTELQPAATSAQIQWSDAEAEVIQTDIPLVFKLLSLLDLVYVALDLSGMCRVTAMSVGFPGIGNSSGLYSYGITIGLAFK